MRSQIKSGVLCAIVACTLLSDNSGVATLRGVSDHATCTEVRDWVESNASHLPRTYETLSILPIQYQRAVFGQLSTSERAELWRARLLSSVDKAVYKFSDAEKVQIRAVSELMTSDNFSDKNKESMLLAVNAIIGNNKRVRILIRRLVDPIEPSRFAPVFSGVQGFLERISPAVLLAATPRRDEGTCECWFGESENWCQFLYGNPLYHYSCERSMIENCTSTSNGCGDLWQYPCDGNCESFPNYE